MTEETKQTPTKVSDMIRITAENQNTFLIQIADHIDKLEQAIDELRNRVTAMEETNVDNDQAQ
jgi:polyhydroxyalkanoate synthesis regulator phasin